MLAAAAVAGAALADELPAPKGASAVESGPDAAELVQTYETLKTALKKSSVDYADALAIYEKSLSPLVQAVDASGPTPTSHDPEIQSALAAARTGELPPGAAAQLFDKLMQKIFFLAIRTELAEAGEHLNDPKKALAELDEAKAFYPALRGTVEKRESAYGIPLLHHVDGAFDGMATAIEDGDELGFHLARQILDKSLMKTFYLAVGARPHGYVYKMEAAVRDGDLAKAREMQVEAWSFYQSIYSYLRGSSPADADFINTALDLRADVRNLDAESLNRRFLTAIAAVARHEYEESFKSWGTMRAAVTALEGALFATMLEPDLKAVLGEAEYGRLEAQAQEALTAVQAKNRAKAEAAVRAVEATLSQAVR